MNNVKRKYNLKQLFAIVALATFISAFTISTNDLNAQIKYSEQSTIAFEKSIALIKEQQIEIKRQEKLELEKIAVEKAEAEKARTKALEDAEAVKKEKARVVASAPKTQAVASSASTSGTCEQYRNIISQYSWNVEVAMNVCKAESSGNTFNENLNDYHSFANCRGSFGLFQINCSHGRVFDAEKNIAIAHSMYVASGWQPWAFHTCKVVVRCY